MRQSIVKFTARNSSSIQNGTAHCDKCKAKNLSETFAILTRVGDDVDVFEFANGIWSVCETCMRGYLEQYPERYYLKVERD